MKINVRTGKKVRIKFESGYSLHDGHAYFFSCAGVYRGFKYCDVSLAKQFAQSTAGGFQRT